ncbi:aberrant lateral root formation 4 [Striga asiatica]|uniref:Aberrant lateral root formation 4 n=1 Tax=Striga asiatica TaxID=4170 RepID=A0A5A7R3N5_STRAF|nr:aberrant lateral root formation 4 [Striga asiatica]
MTELPPKLTDKFIAAENPRNFRSIGCCKHGIGKQGLFSSNQFKDHQVSNPTSIFFSCRMMALGIRNHCLPLHHCQASRSMAGAYVASGLRVYFLRLYNARGSPGFRLLLQIRLLRIEMYEYNVDLSK